MTPFIGVRISWLMMARNSLLASSAARAACVSFFCLARARLATRLARTINAPANTLPKISKRPVLRKSAAAFVDGF
jgi:hypothetical protein